MGDGAAYGWAGGRLCLTLRSKAPTHRPLGELDHSVCRLYKRSVAQILHGLHQFGFGIHDNGPMPRNGLIDGCTRNKQKADTLGTCLNSDFVTSSKTDQCAISREVTDVKFLP